MERLNGEILGLSPTVKAVVSIRLELKRQLRVCVQKFGGRYPLGKLRFRIA